MLRIVAVVVFCLAFASGKAQSGLAEPDPPHRDWHAYWVTHPDISPRAPAVLHFRHTLKLEAVPSAYVVRVSADNRFILFVNGRRVGDGPARGDLSHWRDERFDLAPYLRAGENLITAAVWNFGVYAPTAQISDRTAFLLESDALGSEGISTPAGWLVEQEVGHHLIPRRLEDFSVQMLSGPGEEIDAAHYDWRWNQAEDVSDLWKPVALAIPEWISPNDSKGFSSSDDRNNAWGLTPDLLPAMEYQETSPGEVVRTDLPGGQSFPANGVVIPSHSHVRLLLDRKTLTTAYPALTVSGGKDARIRLTYAEALFDEKQRKGDRDEVADRRALGTADLFKLDGGNSRTFTPLWWRTWRYLELDVTTDSEPVRLDSFKAWFTAYPFQERASFQSDDPTLSKIWEISWRTIRTGSHETYTDSPYYEQLQYVGDARIESLISYAVSGDDRLARQAIDAFDESRSAEGLTRSRYPSSLAQTIPTFSLLWVGMVHDYWMYRPDAQAVHHWLAGTRTVLSWFLKYQQPDGLLRKLPWWSFVDWVPSGAIPTYDSHQESCTTTLQYLGALNDAADLERALGDPELAQRYVSRANHVRLGLFNKCWSKSHKLIADSPDQQIFSQQSNILAVLYDVIPKRQQADVLRRMISINPGDVRSDGVLSASYYFRFYLARAMDHAGLADLYVSSLDPWRQLLPLHFSTWPEIPGNSRSDAHAWTAHPIYDLLTLAAGIQPASPGFRTVRIAPHLGSLPRIAATYPHPEGEISVEYHQQPPGFRARIVLPGSLTGTFMLNGVSRPLHPGLNQLTIPIRSGHRDSDQAASGPQHAP